MNHKKVAEINYSKNSSKLFTYCPIIRMYVCVYDEAGTKKFKITKYKMCFFLSFITMKEDETSPDTKTKNIDILSVNFNSISFFFRFSNRQ